MVSFNTLVITSAAIASVHGQNMVQSIADKLASAMIQNRNSNVPEVVARDEVNKIVGFVTTDSHLSAYYESAMQTGDHSVFNPALASAYLTSIGSVVSSVTRKPDFYQMINSARHNTNNYNVDQIMTTANNEVVPHVCSAYSKISAVSATDAGVSSLAQSLSRDFMAVATKVLLNSFGGSFMVDANGEEQLNMALFLENYPGINEFWGEQENGLGKENIVVNV